MQTFNLLNEIITVSRPALLSAVNSGKRFGITTRGDVVTEPFPERVCYIYRGWVPRPAPSALAPSKATSIAELLGTNYRVVEDDERLLIKAAGNWQEIIGFNVGNADYDDTSGDGIAEFTDGDLEAIGWQATEFSITYRELVEVIEAHCDGTLLCIEREGEHYQFSGMGFIDDLACARKQCFDYCVGRIKKVLEEDPLYRGDNLTEDEEEALAFFGIRVPTLP